MDKKILTKELATRIRKYRVKAKQIKIDETGLGNTVFVQDKNETLFNPKYLKVAEYFDIKALEATVKCYPDILDEEVVCIISSAKEEFEFLQKLNLAMPNMVDDLKRHGAKAVAISYISNMLYPKKDENIEV